MNLSQYPKLLHAAIEIAYDNGIVNRMNSQEDMVRDVEKALEESELEVSAAMLKRVDDHLATLTPEVLDALLTGGDQPEPTNDIETDTEIVLTIIFEGM